MRPCFAWCAKALAWTSGCCAHLAWPEPNVVVCASACCNTQQPSEDYLALLDRVRKQFGERRAATV